MVVLVRAGAEIASWPLTGDRSGLSIVDDLARLQLTAKRIGCSIQLHRPCADLVGLLELAGLRGVLEVVGEAEGGEEVRVDEVVVTDDPVA